ncbi:MULTISPECIES: LysR family transcriptional regulator [unclassified Roseovarius]|uniref:LysR family transcriptional regulator n=1 Tax=unclassified Roseovarius TaxID=2614913 RepID=UPI00273F9E45|nr:MULTISPECIES: LysR family transcriptional regulator [unclassified Roseovarius]
MERIPTQGIDVFLAIVREGSLRGAARVLGIGAPAVSLQLKALEERLGVSLLIRTTRSIELTDAGRTLFDGASPAYRDMTDAIKKTCEIGTALNGTLRLSLSRGAYMVALAPVLDGFLAAHPGIKLDLSWSEDLIDINREGYHAGIRLGDILTPSMVAVRLTPPLKSAFIAAPSYLDKAGRPQHPRDLLAHQCIRYKLPSARKIADWHFVEDGQVKLIDPPARLAFDTVIGVIQAARDGFGIGWSLHETARDYIENKSLEVILESFAREMPPFYLYYPEQNRRVECLRLLIDYLVAHRDRMARAKVVR